MSRSFCAEFLSLLRYLCFLRLRCMRNYMLTTHSGELKMPKMVETAITIRFSGHFYRMAKFTPAICGMEHGLKGQGDTIRVVIIFHQNSLTDAFDVKFVSPTDFTACKNGQDYRYGKITDSTAAQEAES